jgi:hypothetical protein
VYNLGYLVSLILWSSLQFSMVNTLDSIPNEDLVITCLSRLEFYHLKSEELLYIMGKLVEYFPFLS